ncbi:MAG: hypothetical protein ABWY19_07690 [Marmoricola sp.]
MRKLGTALALTTLVLSCLVGCGEKSSKKLDIGSSSDAPPPPSPAAGAAFAMPEPGDEIGADGPARPPADESAQGASVFAAWALSLLLHTPREDASTDLWTEVSATGCEPCQGAAGVWQKQESEDQVFAYDGPPTFSRTVVRAQPRGDSWFVQFEVAVPSSTLREADRVLESSEAQTLGYSFTVTWAENDWQIQDFHVLG